MQLAQATPTHVVLPALAALGLGGGMAIAVFSLALRAGRFPRADAAALAGAGYRAIIHEVLLNRSVFLLFAGVLVGLISGPKRFEPFELLFITAFKPILAFFILEMGLLAALRLPELRKSGPLLFAAAVMVPIAGGLVGGWLGVMSGLSSGGATVLATLAASASYIAAPAATRMAIPEANTCMCVAAALGITFPFNLALGIPLYAWWVERLVAGTSEAVSSKTIFRFILSAAKNPLALPHL